MIQILKLHKNNLRKYKMPFLNDDLFNIYKISKQF